jgi:hypothetical protein
MDSITDLIAKDPVVLDAFYQVAHLLKSPVVLFHPKVALRVFKERRSSHGAAPQSLSVGTD